MKLQHHLSCISALGFLTFALPKAGAANALCDIPHHRFGRWRSSPRDGHRPVKADRHRPAPLRCRFSLPAASSTDAAGVSGIRNQSSEIWTATGERRVGRAAAC